MKSESLKAVEELRRDRESFERYFDRRGPMECWIWKGCMDQHGRGRYYMKITRKMTFASRAAWWISTGAPPPKELLVCHHCDNPPCVNPRHLFVGTGADNVRDMMRKGRARFNPFLPGAEHPSAKLTESDIPKIIKAYRDGEKQRPIARRFGVSQNTISKVVRGATWAHIR